MKLQLPGDVLTDSQAAFEFERGGFAGRAFTASVFVCGNPTCDCQTVTFNCTEGAGSPQPATAATQEAATPNPKTYFTLALKQRQVAQDDPPTPAPEAARLTAAFIEEMTDADWQSLEHLYRAVKRSQTERINPDEVEARFQEQVLDDPSLLVGYGEIFPHAETFSTSCYGGHWLVVDQYCVNPRCACQDALLNFIRVPEGASQLQDLRGDGPSFFYNHEDGTIDPDSHHEAEAHAVLQALIQERPDLNRLLGDRHRLLRQLYARQQAAARPVAMQSIRRTKIGRNDPCPCGSGRKYKKCCGGPNQQSAIVNRKSPIP
jgi:SEC-C motif